MGHVLVKWDAPTHTTFLLGLSSGVQKKYLGVSQPIYEHMYKVNEKFTRCPVTPVGIT
jgi:hypothetical protein